MTDQYESHRGIVVSMRKVGRAMMDIARDTGLGFNTVFEFIEECPDLVTPTVHTATHELKTWPHYFNEIISHRKKFEVRKDDREFRYSDILLLREWLPYAESYTGRSCLVEVTYVCSLRPLFDASAMSIVPFLLYTGTDPCVLPQAAPAPEVVPRVTNDKEDDLARLRVLLNRTRMERDSAERLLADIRRCIEIHSDNRSR